jgi:hypothetical protein
MAEIVIVEHLFETALTDEEHGRAGKRLDECAKLRNVRWMRSYLATDRMRMFCEFEGPDVESVRDAHRSAGITFARAWAAELYKL